LAAGPFDSEPRNPFYRSMMRDGEVYLVAQPHELMFSDEIGNWTWYISEVRNEAGSIEVRFRGVLGVFAATSPRPLSELSEAELILLCQA
jgi:hypothetical protein